MTDVSLNVSVHLDGLATDIASCGASDDELLGFIMRLDEEIADYHFTVELRDRLNAAIALEEDD